MVASLPPAIKEPTDRALETIQGFYNKVSSIYERGQAQAIQFTTTHLPEKLHPIASKVIRSLPETLFCASMFTGMLKPVAFCIFATKTAHVLTPFVQKALNDGISRDHMVEALHEAETRFDGVVENIHPALLTSSAIGGALSVAIAVCRFSPTMAMHSAFFGLLGVIAYRNMQAVSQTQK